MTNNDTFLLRQGNLGLLDLKWQAYAVAQSPENGSSGPFNRMRQLSVPRASVAANIPALKLGTIFQDCANKNLFDDYDDFLAQTISNLWHGVLSQGIARPPRYPGLGTSPEPVTSDRKVAVPRIDRRQGELRRRR